MKRREDPESDADADADIGAGPEAGSDAFAHPAEGPDDSTFELAQDSGPHVTKPSHDVDPIVLQPRKPVAYNGARGGMSKLLVWGFAGLGFLVVAGVGVRFMIGSGREVVPAATVGAPPAPVPAKPVGEGVLIQVEAPRRARLLLDGEDLPSNPVRLQRGSVHTIAAVGEDGEQAEVLVTADAPKTIELRLGRKK
jgi:hypothetical protein